MEITVALKRGEVTAELEESHQAGGSPLFRRPAER